MKLNGKSIDPPSPIELMFYRGAETIKLVLGPVMTYDGFEEIVSLPKPPLVMNRKTGKNSHDYNDRTYNAKIAEYSELRTAWHVITSLSATPNLEWESVNIKEPDTWLKWTEELSKCFTDLEMQEILRATQDASHPNEKRYKEALDSFTSSQAEVGTMDTSSLTAEQPVTQSGEPANVSV